MQQHVVLALGLDDGATLFVCLLYFTIYTKSFLIFFTITERLLKIKDYSRLSAELLAFSVP
jgi:hypothetical protein